ncbi:hypothetical protein BN439_0948 [Erwinia amylovora Ea644]|uniref:hypothetical protein n=1 Tax=Erwinia amylovora TaxID=552 RepID=UPI0002C92F2B|nr:hypothetical protein [Erwinia amylovora]CCP02036.1 hypothetical protein BN439_0948 [Erwinia amylovora Ea644]
MAEEPRPGAPLSLHDKKAKGWRAARPQDHIRKGEWWAVYQDATLNGLLRQVQISNQNVAQYQALALAA